MIEFLIYAFLGNPGLFMCLVPTAGFAFSVFMHRATRKHS